jgi:hypothetical protein
MADADLDFDDVARGEKKGNGTPPCLGLLAGERAKWALFAYALSMTTLVGGVVYGWPSLRAVLIEEGALYDGECAATATAATAALLLATNATDLGTPSPSSSALTSECPEQAKRLGVVFACGAWSVQACRMVTGLARDRYGTRVTVVGVMLLVAVGIVLLGRVGCMLWGWMHFHVTLCCSPKHIQLQSMPGSMVPI